MTAPSTWWRLPVRPSRWFDEELLARSEAMHRPVRRVAVARETARLVALVALALVVRADHWPGPSVLLGLAVIVVWRLPAQAAASWLLSVHAPRWGRPSFPIVDVRVGLPLGWGRVPGADEPVAPAVENEIASLAGRAGLHHFGVVSGGSAVPGANAFVAGIGKRRRLVVGLGLVEVSPEQRRFVLAHELAHLRRHHVIRTVVVSVLVWAFSLGVAGWAVASGTWFERLSGVGPTEPRALAALAVVGAVARLPATLVVRWFHRAHERRADVDALRLVDAGPSALRSLHLTEFADLCPPRWAQAFAVHPSPAERLELAKLCS